MQLLFDFFPLIAFFVAFVTFDLYVATATIIVATAGDDLDAALAKAAGEVEALGRKAYVIPGGASNALGALGYVVCAHEIAAQSFDQGVSFDRIVVSSGSCGTHSGLLVGARSVNFDAPITGVNSRRPRAEQEANVLKLARETAALLQIDAPAAKEVTALDDWVGPGYSLPSEEMIEAVRMLARLEGVLLDPVYSGKAMAGLIGLARRGELKRGERVLFLHTGGSPALYAYQRVLQVDPLAIPARLGLASSLTALGKLGAAV